jgi:hypothetical protein
MLLQYRQSVDNVSFWGVCFDKISDAAVGAFARRRLRFRNAVEFEACCLEGTF